MVPFSDAELHMLKSLLTAVLKASLIQDKYSVSPKYQKTLQDQHYTEEMKCHDSSISWPYF